MHSRHPTVLHAFSTCIRPMTSSAVSSVKIKSFVKMNSFVFMQCYNQIRRHGGNVGADAPTIPITFVNPHPSSNNSEPEVSVDARIGDTLLQTAQRCSIDLEGACEGVCACSTCHLIFDYSAYDCLPESTEEEEDMLDLAFGLTETSRLGCQVLVTQEMGGIKVRLPDSTRNFYVDGHIPQPH